MIKFEIIYMYLESRKKNINKKKNESRNLKYLKAENTRNTLKIHIYDKKNNGTKKSIGKSLKRNDGKLKRKGVRLKKKFEYTRRSGENIQEEERSLELQKRRRRNG